MNNETKNTKISEQDLAFVEQTLAQTNRPSLLREITEKLAFEKTANQRIQEVKKYDPCFSYEVGDSLYKEYDENLPVSSKGVERFKGAVVLKVINKTFFKNFNCEMLEVDYTGGGVFRKYIDYMKKTKTQVLLPCNLGRENRAAEKMEEEKDPRLSELPMTDRDLKTLEKNLRTMLSKSPKFYTWNDYWQLSEKRVEIPEEKIKEIENYFLEVKTSLLTEELVQKFFGLEPSSDIFELQCLSLDYALGKKYKKEFVSVWPFNWGKWLLKSILNSFPESLPLAAPPAKLPAFEDEVAAETSAPHAFPLKVYLSWREILSGGIKIPRSLNKELSLSLEYLFTDPEGGKGYTVFYYPSEGYFLGLKDFFAANNVPQGTSLTLEKKGPTQFNFWLKKEKKKLSVVKLAYDSKEDLFSDHGEEVFTYFLPNKIIYLERETLAKLFPLYKQRDDVDLRQLLILIYKNFGLPSNNFSLHYLRAYHLVDLLKKTTQEEVERTLLNSTEFSLSEKKKGLFYYHEAPEIKEEAKSEIQIEIPVQVPFEGAPEVVPGYEFEVERAEEIPVEVPPQAQIIEFERAKLETPQPAKKEKLPKKKRIKIEGEKIPKARKSERRVIEERIEIEESEQEALTAIKAQEKKEGEEEKAEALSKDKKEEFKPAASGQPAFGLFAEKLKSALSKKQKEEEKKK
jgi:hypothetical protein